MDWLTVSSNLHPTDFNIVLFEILLGLGKRVKCMKIDLVICALVAKAVELLHGFHLLAALWAIGDIEYFRETESTC